MDAVLNQLGEGLRWSCSGGLGAYTNVCATGVSGKAQTILSALRGWGGAGRNVALQGRAERRGQECLRYEGAAGKLVLFGSHCKMNCNVSVIRCS